MTLYSLGKHFLGHHRPAPSSVATNPVAAPAGAVDTYPVVVFHPASLGDDIKATLRASVAAGLRAANATDEGGAPVRNADLRLVTIDIGVPAWMKATLTPAQLESYSYTCAPFPPFSLAYMQMNRWFTWKMYVHPALAGYDYYMRIDSDSHFYETPRVDPFAMMRQRGLDFAYLRQAKDPDCLYTGLYAAVAEYRRRAAISHEVRLPGQGLDSRAVRNIDHVVYNGFVGVGRLGFFQSRSYLAFAEFLNEEKRGVFTARWSDQQVYPIALRLLLPTPRVQKWQQQGDNAHPSGFPVTTHIHGMFWKRFKAKRDAEYAAAMATPPSGPSATSADKGGWVYARREEKDAAAAASVAPLAGHTVFGGWTERTHDAAMDAAVQAIARAQNPPSCAGARYLAFRFRKVGLGSEMHSMSVALSYAQRTRRILVVDRASWPELHHDCALDTHTCYFRTLSECSAPDAAVAESERFNPRGGDQSGVPVLHFDLKAAVAHRSWRRGPPAPCCWRAVAH